MSLTATGNLADPRSRAQGTTEPAPEPLQNAYYVYDGDGNLVKATINGKPTYYLGNPGSKTTGAGLYHKKIDGTSETIQKYYSSCSAQIAVRTVTGTSDTLQWMLSDHLGSTSTTANVDGTLPLPLRYEVLRCAAQNSTIQYTAFGEIRASTGISNTEFRYTGQLRQAELGLYYYVARWYDPQLGHFTQADTIVPNAGDSAAYDRYAYVKNNPVKYNDPSGHMYSCGGICGGDTRPYLSWAQGTGQISYSAYNARLASVRSREASVYKITASYRPKFIPSNNQKRSIPTSILLKPEYQIHHYSKPNGQLANQVTNQLVSLAPLKRINEKDAAIALLEISSNGMDLAAEYFQWQSKVLPGINILSGYALQQVKDADSGLSFYEKHNRALVYGGEQLAIGVLAIGTGAGLGLTSSPSGPGAFVVGLTAYVGMNKFGNYLADEANRQALFPLIHDLSK